MHHTEVSFIEPSTGEASNAPRWHDGSMSILAAFVGMHCIQKARRDEQELAPRAPILGRPECLAKRTATMDQNQEPLSPRGEPVGVLGLILVGGALDTTARPSKTTNSGQERHVLARATYRFLPLLWCLLVGIGCATGGPLEDTEDDSPGSPARGSDADGGRPRTPTPSSPASSSPAPSSTSTGCERDRQDAATRDGSLVPDAVAADARPDTSTAIDGGPCAHPTTSTGGPLSVTCSPCVAAVCATNPGCCTSAWDTTCLIQQSLNAACKP